jgi:hypothetical protein
MGRTAKTKFAKAMTESEKKSLQERLKDVVREKSGEQLVFDKTKKLLNNVVGQKFITIKRVHDTLTMRDMSMLLLERAITTAAGGKVDACRMSRAGVLTVKTQNVKQALSLIKLTQITQDIQVVVEENAALSTTKAVIYGYELKHEDEEELQEHLKSQNVVKVEMVTRNTDSGKVKTGTVFVTFGTPEMPETLTIGPIQYRTTLYIPKPMRCFNCHQFGHISRRCQSAETPKCYNCNDAKHLTDKSEKCNKNPYCVACKSTEHNSYHRECPALIRETKIITIKTTQRVTFPEAVKQYNTTQIKTQESYAATLKGNMKTCTCKCTCGDQNQSQIDTKQAEKPQEKGNEKDEHTNEINANDTNEMEGKRKREETTNEDSDAEDMTKKRKEEKEEIPESGSIEDGSYMGE